MRIATQNIQWGGDPAPGGDGSRRLKKLLPLLAGFDADLLVLTEYKSGTSGAETKSLLAESGYLHFLENLQAFGDLGVAIAARQPLVRIELPIPVHIDPWRSIGASINGVEVFGFYFPLGDAKPIYWDWVLANAEKLKGRDAILIGDFNTGKYHLDETGATFECSEKHEALEVLGFVDTWRAAYPNGRDYTWYSQYRNGFRLDYLWASPSLAERIERVWHDHVPRLTLSTDHSAVVADIALTAEDAAKAESTTPLGNGEVLGNIFKLGEYMVAEDRFSAAWGYVLTREPRLAQAVADILMRDRELRPRVIKVTDHPDCKSLKKPDFRIECEGFDILVEHKLDALLHADQLESYLELQSAKPTYLAFIAPAFQVVPAPVLSHPNYLAPGRKEHFRWSDFHTAVNTQSGWLTAEFADYMTSLGMAPFALKGPEDIFDARAKPVQFDEALRRAAEDIFVKNNRGCWLKGTPTGLGREVRKPGAGLSLIYIWAEQRSTQISDFEGPVLAVNVFERDDATGSPNTGGSVSTPSGLVVRRHRLVSPIKMGEGRCRVTYAAPLVEIIQETLDETVHHMSELLAVVRADHWPRN